MYVQLVDDGERRFFELVESLKGGRVRICFAAQNMFQMSRVSEDLVSVMLTVDEAKDLRDELSAFLKRFETAEI